MEVRDPLSPYPGWPHEAALKRIHYVAIQWLHMGGHRHRHLHRAPGAQARGARVGINRRFGLCGGLENRRSFALKEGELAHAVSSAHSSVSGKASTPSARGKRSLPP